MTSIAANEDEEEEEDEGLPMNQQKRVSYTAPKAVLKDIAQVKDYFSLKCLSTY